MECSVVTPVLSSLLFLSACRQSSVTGSEQPRVSHGLPVCEVLVAVGWDGLGCRVFSSFHSICCYTCSSVALLWSCLKVLELASWTSMSLWCGLVIHWAWEAFMWIGAAGCIRLEIHFASTYPLLSSKVVHVVAFPDLRVVGVTCYLVFLLLWDRLSLCCPDWPLTDSPSSMVCYQCWSFTVFQNLLVRDFKLLSLFWLAC